MSTITVIHRTCNHCGRSELHGVRMAHMVTRWWEMGAPTVDVCVDCAAAGYVACDRCYEVHLSSHPCIPIAIVEDTPIVAMEWRT